MKCYIVTYGINWVTTSWTDGKIVIIFTICPRSSYSFYKVTYYIKWVYFLDTQYEYHCIALHLVLLRSKLQKIGSSPFSAVCLQNNKFLCAVHFLKSRQLLSDPWVHTSRVKYRKQFMYLNSFTFSIRRVEVLFFHRYTRTWKWESKSSSFLLIGYKWVNEG